MAKIYDMKGKRISSDSDVPQRTDIHIALDWNKPTDREIWVSQLRFQGTHAAYKMATSPECPADAKLIAGLAAPFLSSVLDFLHEKNWELIYTHYPDLRGQALTFNCSEGLITSDKDPKGPPEPEKI